MRRFLPYIGVMMAAVLLAAFESNLLYELQEQNLFMHSTLFFGQRMVTAGGLLTWMGSYLTQYFYYPVLGAGLMALLWACLVWLLQKTFRLPDSWMGLTLVPVACLLLTIVDMGYWVYYLKLPGHAFVATLGTIVAVAMTWAYRQVPRRWGLSILFVILAACIGYPLFGFYGLLAVLLTGIVSRRLADTLAAIVAIVAVPLAYYYMLYHETNLVNIYWTALPVFAMHGERYFAYNLPYIGLAVSLAAFALLNRERSHRDCMGNWGRWGERVLLPLAVICVALFWYRDGNFHRELAMSRQMEQLHWEQVLANAKVAKGEPTRAMCVMRNLALLRLGRLEKEMFQYPDGARRPDAPFPVHLVHTVGKRLYLQYGIPNYCYRWCMEDGVEYGWTVERLKLMAQCSLLNGELTVAQRYLNMLKKTDFHKSWAQRYEACVQQPKLIAEDPELKPVIPLLRYDNFLTADQSQLELFLVEHILSAPGDTPEQQELKRATMRYYRKNRHSLVEQ